MAYNFRCTYCGWQEASHDYDIEEGLEKLATRRQSGYRVSLNECPGFTYRRMDYKRVVEEYLADPTASSEEGLLPPDLEERATRLRKQRRRKLGLPEEVFLEPIMCIITSRGVFTL